MVFTRKMVFFFMGTCCFSMGTWWFLVASSSLLNWKALAFDMTMTGNNIRDRKKVYCFQQDNCALLSIGKPSMVFTRERQLVIIGQ